MRFNVSQAASCSLEGIAAARNGPADTSSHAPLAHEAADRQARPNRAAGRMKKDRKLALAQSVEQVAQAAGRILIDRTLRGDPFATAPAAGVRVAFRHVEHDRRPHLRGLRLGRRAIGAGRQRTRHAGRQQDDARKEKTTEYDHEAIQLAVAYTFIGLQVPLP